MTDQQIKEEVQDEALVEKSREMHDRSYACNDKLKLILEEYRCILQGVPVIAENGTLTARVRIVPLE
jgi:hypothetical protein